MIQNNEIILDGVLFEWTPLFLVYKFNSSDRSILFVSESNKNVEYIYNFIKTHYKDINIFKILEFESEVYEETLYEQEIFNSRAEFLYRILECREKYIILSTFKSISFRIPDPSYFIDNFLDIKKNDDLSINDIENKLQYLGYTRSNLTTRKGDYSIRGGIIDIFPVLYDTPFRLDFFGDEIESIKSFDKNSQKSIENVENIKITRALEIIPLNADKNKILNDERYQDIIDSSIKDSIENNCIFAGIQWYLPIFNDNPHDIRDYIKDNILIIFDFEIEKLNAKFHENTHQKYEKFKSKCMDHNLLFENIIHDFAYDDKFDVQRISPFNENNIIKDISFNENIRTKEGMKFFLDRIENAKKNDKKIIISTQSPGATYIISNLLKDQKIYDIEMLDHNRIEDARNYISITQSNLLKGCLYDNKYEIYTENELFGFILRSSSHNKNPRNAFKDYSKLKVGDIVIHKNHGKAIFRGIEMMNIDGIHHDFLCLEYRDNDKLFIPVENIDLVSLYGNNDDPLKNVELDKLGSKTWSNKKENIRKKLLTITNELIKVAAIRRTRHLEAISYDSEEYDKFCRKFPYIETEDQINAIDDVINDLKSGIPMDRLICGDVGFGKTEIALRTAFIIASSYKQVILLSPTTILVDQHYNNFIKRFEDFPNITIRKLTRHISNKEVNEIISKFNNSEINILITTHSIFAKKIKYDNLGLLIIDEEQRFGVKQKEIIKNMKNDIHILTLSATPIPRTLQLATSGILDLSIISSPPLNRLPVKTFVIEENNDTIKNAIENEIKRGGQIFIVSPRIEHINDIYNNILKIVPYAKISIAHGQMKNIEDIIEDFYYKKSNILISTNIIDSGIDIPNANTIILYRPDLLGLSQIYQLRGRVGRSKTQAYAYIVLPRQKIMSKESKIRIEIIQKLNTLGSGILLSSYDMDMRGSGNIIGEEQSGYIKDVGIELYQNMLEEMIIMQKSNKNIENFETFSPQINIGLPVLIPCSYIEDPEIRMTIYRRIGDIKDHHEIEMIELELCDRFGNIPDEVLNLLNVVRIKLYCTIANIEKIETGIYGVLFSFFNNQFNNTDKLLEFIKKYDSILKIRNDQKIILQKRWRSIEDRTKDIINITKILSSINQG